MLVHLLLLLWLVQLRCLVELLGWSLAELLLIDWSLAFY